MGGIVLGVRGGGGGKWGVDENELGGLPFRDPGGGGGVTCEGGGGEKVGERGRRQHPSVTGPKRGKGGREREA